METTYKRIQFNELLARINEPRDKMQVIVGPRQVGKSTLIGQVLEECPLPFDSYSADDVIGASADWLTQIWEAQRLKPQLLRQLFEIGSSYSGELLSLTKVAAQLQDAGNVTTLAGYLHLLDECGLLCGLQKYAEDEARKYNSVPKFQVHNNALRNAYADEDFSEVIENPKQWGRYVESAIGAHLVSQAPIYDYKVYYWRDKKDEVDFVLTRRSKKVAIEIKSGRRTTNQGLSVFTKAYHPHKAFVVGSGGLSFEEFLSMDLNWLFK